MRRALTGDYRRAVRMVFGAVVISVATGSPSLAQQADNRTCGTMWETVTLDAPKAGRPLSQTASRPMLDTSVVSPLGHVRVHYDTTGSHEPALTDQNNMRLPGTHHAYADSIARAYDRSWTVVIEDLGFDAPPEDTDGGDGIYDVYIMNLPPNQFGETQFASAPFATSPNSRYETWILIDNDFTTQRTRGLPGAYVTIAHEFFHAVQIGSYGFWGSADAYWYELSSTWLEGEVFPEVDDYLYEVSRYMTSFRTTSFTEYSAAFPGYERVLFAQFLTKQFGPSAMRLVWERLRSERVIPSLHAMLTAAGTSLPMTFSRFALWNFFTADRADPFSYYARGQQYPRLEPIVLADMTGSSTTLSFPFSPLSHGVFAVRLDTDTLFVMLVNTDVDGVAESGVIGIAPTVVLSRGAQALPSQQLALGITGGLQVRNPSVWDIEYFSSRTGSVAERLEPKPFPNPWDLSLPYDLILPTSEMPGRPVDIFLLTSDLQSVGIGSYAVGEEKGRKAVRVPASAVRDKIGSGVYGVLVRTADNEELTKVVIIQ